MPCMRKEKGVNVSLPLSPARIAGALMLFVVLLNFASVASQYLNYRFGHGGLLEFLPLLHAGNENTLPTWYSSFVLLVGSVLFFVIAAGTGARGERDKVYWVSLSAILLLLSMDEIATVHETFGDVLEVLVRAEGLRPTGFFFFVWVVPGLVLALAAFLVYLRFLLRLPRGTALLLIASGAVYLMGALGAEMVGARLTYLSGEIMTNDEQIVVALVQAAEEFLEMAGAVVLVYALLRHIVPRMGTARIVVSSEESDAA